MKRRDRMEFLIYIGAIFAGVGILTIGYCMKMALSIRKEADEDAAQKRLQGLVVWNLGALSLSAFGLIMVVIGMVL